MVKRIQLSRKKGWRKPAGAVVVARPSQWGNPFRVTGPTKEAQADAVETFEQWTRQDPKGKELARRARVELRGKTLCCWCKPGEPCHADVLLKLANMPV